MRSDAPAGTVRQAQVCIAGCRQRSMNSRNVCRLCTRSSRSSSMRRARLEVGRARRARVGARVQAFDLGSELGEPQQRSGSSLGCAWRMRSASARAFSADQRGADLAPPAGEQRHHPVGLDLDSRCASRPRRRGVDTSCTITTQREVALQAEIGVVSAAPSITRAGQRLSSGSGAPAAAAVLAHRGLTSVQADQPLAAASSASRSASRGTRRRSPWAARALLPERAGLELM
jgi:hypothetical protein